MECLSSRAFNFVWLLKFTAVSDADERIQTLCVLFKFGYLELEVTGDQENKKFCLG